MKQGKRSRFALIWSVLVAFALIAAACGGGSSGDGAADGASGDDGTDTTAVATSDDKESFDSDQSGDDVAERASGGSDDEKEEVTEEDSTSGTDGISSRNADSLVLALNDQRFTGQEPQAGGVLVHHWRADTASLDPRKSSTYHLHYRVGPVYQRLYAPVTGPDVAHYELSLQPQLAVAPPEISADGLTYTVKLRDGVVWQDIAPVNGRAFTADDVVATMNSYKADGFQSGFLDRVESIEATDDLTVQFNLSAPFAPLANFLGNHHMWIMPAEATVDGSGYDADAQPIGTGPFQIVKREVDVETIYEKNPTYWEKDADGNQLPYLDGFELVIIKDQDQAMAAFKAGELDVSDNDLTLEVQEQLANEYPEGQYFAWLHGSTLLLGMNLDKEELQNADVRRAISMAIDREGMGKAIRGGGTFSGPVNVNVLDFALPQDERAEFLKYDPEGAKKLLADAGYADGFEIGLIHTDRYGPAYVAQTEWVAEDLKQLGLDVTIETLDYGTYFTDRWPNQAYDLQIGPQTPFTEADEWLRGQYSTGGGRNWSGLSDPALDALIEEQLELTNIDERREKIFEIQRYILENALPPIPLWTHVQRKQMQPWVRGYSNEHPTYGFVGLQFAWLDK